MFDCCADMGVQSPSTKVEGDEGCIGPSGKLLCMWRTKNKICCTSMATFRTCLTVVPIWVYNLLLLKSSMNISNTLSYTFSLFHRWMASLTLTKPRSWYTATTTTSLSLYLQEHLHPLSLSLSIYKNTYTLSLSLSHTHTPSLSIQHTQTHSTKFCLIFLKGMKLKILNRESFQKVFSTNERKIKRAKWRKEPSIFY